MTQQLLNEINSIKDVNQELISKINYLVEKLDNFKDELDNAKFSMSELESALDRN